MYRLSAFLFAPLINYKFIGCVWSGFNFPYSVVSLKHFRQTVPFDKVCTWVWQKIDDNILPKIGIPFSLPRIDV